MMQLVLAPQFVPVLFRQFELRRNSRATLRATEYLPESGNVIFFLLRRR